MMWYFFDNRCSAPHQRIATRAYLAPPTPMSMPHRCRRALCAQALAWQRQPSPHMLSKRCTQLQQLHPAAPSAEHLANRCSVHLSVWELVTGALSSGWPSVQLLDNQSRHAASPCTCAAPMRHSPHTRLQILARGSGARGGGLSRCAQARSRASPGHPQQQRRANGGAGNGVGTGQPYAAHLHAHSAPQSIGDNRIPGGWRGGLTHAGDARASSTCRRCRTLPLRQAHEQIHAVCANPHSKSPTLAHDARAGGRCCVCCCCCCCSRLALLSHTHTLRWRFSLKLTVNNGGSAGEPYGAFIVCIPGVQFKATIQHSSTTTGWVPDYPIPEVVRMQE